MHERTAGITPTASMLPRTEVQEALNGKWGHLRAAGKGRVGGKGPADAAAVARPAAGAGGEARSTSMWPRSPPRPTQPTRCPRLEGRPRAGARSSPCAAKIRSWQGGDGCGRRGCGAFQEVKRSWAGGGHAGRGRGGGWPPGGTGGDAGGEGEKSLTSRRSHAPDGNSRRMHALFLWREGGENCGDPSQQGGSCCTHQGGVTQSRRFVRSWAVVRTHHVTPSSRRRRPVP